MAWMAPKTFSRKDPYLGWTFERNFKNCADIMGHMPHDVVLPFLVKTSTNLNDIRLPLGAKLSSYNDESDYGVVYCPKSKINDLEELCEDMSIAFPVADILPSELVINVKGCNK